MDYFNSNGGYFLWKKKSNEKANEDKKRNPWIEEMVEASGIYTLQISFKIERGSLGIDFGELGLFFDSGTNVSSFT